MITINAVLAAQTDGTLHLPLPKELLGCTVEVSATLKPVGEGIPRATPEMVERRKAAFRRLRELGGLREVIPDPVAWQRSQR